MFKKIAGFKCFVAACIVSLCSATGLRAQAPLDTAKLNQLFDVLETTNKSMCAVAIARNGHILYERRIGFRDSTAKGVLLPDEHTKYRIGSITKMFTAVMIVQLVEEGRLSYDTKLSDFFPEIPNAGKITIEQMLTHHSGLPRYENIDDQDKIRTKKTAEDMIRTVSKNDGNPEDVEKGHYSNLNYILLGLILEKVTHSTFDEQLKLRITDRCGLHNTYNLQHYIDAKKNEAHSFNFSKGKWVEDYEYEWAGYTNAAGYMVSTPRELDKFIYSLFTGKLVSNASLQRMSTMHGNFGYALMKTPFDKHTGYGHSGRLEGFVSGVSYFPEDSLAVSIIINGQIYPMNDIMIGVLSIVFNQPYTIPSLATIQLGNDVLDKYEGSYYGKEAPYKCIVKRKDGRLQVQLKKEGGLLKMVLAMNALSQTRFINESQGIIADFIKDKNGTYSTMTMKISGAKLHLARR
jgi:CubicO group peptidase (beta-lactamase class C family)